MGKYVCYQIKRTSPFLLFHLVISVFMSFICRMSDSHLVLLEVLLGSIHYWIWIMVSFVLFDDVSNGMVARVIMNGGTRLKIALCKSSSICVVALAMILSNVMIGLLFDKADAMKDAKCFVCWVAVPLLTFAISVLSSLINIITGNIYVAIILVFLYINEWFFTMISGLCENSQWILLSKNPFYLTLKIFYTGKGTVGEIFICLFFYLLLCIVSFVAFVHKDFKFSYD